LERDPGAEGAQVCRSHQVAARKTSRQGKAKEGGRKETAGGGKEEVLEAGDRHDHGGKGGGGGVGGCGCVGGEREGDYVNPTSFSHFPLNSYTSIAHAFLLALPASR